MSRGSIRLVRDVVSADTHISTSWSKLTSLLTGCVKVTSWKLAAIVIHVYIRRSAKRSFKDAMAWWVRDY